MVAKALTKPQRAHVVGQERTRELLALSLRSGRTAHAYLLTGTRGVGKTAIALEFASLLLCDGNGSAPCDSCPQCQLTARLQHPDLHLVFPLPATRKRKRDDRAAVFSDEALRDGPEAEVKGEDPATTLAERIESLTTALAADPYHPVTLPRMRRTEDETAARKAETQIIRIEQLRSVMRTAAHTPFQAARKVFVFLRADMMNEESQNAFLKLLEEPPPDSYFLLVTDNERGLFPTVRSRCLRIHVPPLATAEIVAALTKNGVPLAQAETAARLARGSLTHARELTAANLDDVAAWALQFMRYASVCDPVKLAQLVESLPEPKSPAEDTHLLLLRTLLCEAAFMDVNGNRGVRSGVFAPFRTDIEKMRRSFPDAQFDAALAATDEASRYLTQGYTRNFVFFALAMHLQEALGTRRSTKT